MSEEDLISKKLFVREEDVLENLSKLLDRLSRFVKIEPSKGKPILEERDLPLRHSLFLLLTARYFYIKAKKLDDFSMSISELAELVGKPVTSLSGVLGDLVKSGYVVKVEQGKYQVAYYKITAFLDEFERANK